MTNMMHFGL